MLSDSFCIIAQIPDLSRGDLCFLCFLWCIFAETDGREDTTCINNTHLSEITALRSDVADFLTGDIAFLNAVLFGHFRGNPAGSTFLDIGSQIVHSLAGGFLPIIQFLSELHIIFDLTCD